MKRLFALLLSATLPAIAEPQTRLLLVGGGEHPPAAMRAFYQWAGHEQSRILVIPWATAVPQESFDEFAKDFEGWPRASMQLAPLAPLTGESRTRLLQQLEEASAIWFTGGDQVKVMNVLQDRELLERLRQLYRRGIPFGGTSAGTAIMSLRMLTGEADLSVIDGNRVETREGLGLLPESVIVDQHFIKRQRQNRLFGLVLLHRPCLGLAIDEDTAVLLEDGREAKVEGKSKVMLMKAGDSGDTLRLRLYRSGQRFQLNSAATEEGP